MSETAPEYQYDAFISYSHANAEWVQTWLVPKLEAAGLTLAVDYRDFEVGLPSMINMERAVADSRHTVLVLTPEWVASEYTAFEALLVQTDDPAGLQRRLIPVMLAPCKPPQRIRILTYVDFTKKSAREQALQRLVAAIDEDPGPLPPPPPPPPRWPKVAGGIVFLAVAAYGLCVFWLCADTEPIVAILPSPTVYQQLPASGDPVVSSYSLRLTWPEGSMQIDSVRQSVIFAGKNAALRALFDEAPDVIYAGAAAYLADFPEAARMHLLQAYQAHPRRMPMTGLQPDAVVTAVLLRSDQDTVAIATGTVQNSATPTYLILKPPR